MIGGYIHEDPKHVQEGREIGTAVDPKLSPGSFPGSYESYFSLRLAISGDYEFLAIRLAELLICCQLGHSTMLDGHLQSKGHVSNHQSIYYEPKCNLSAAKR